MNHRAVDDKVDPIAGASLQRDRQFDADTVADRSTNEARLRSMAGAAWRRNFVA
jgi:hypothetical protein